MVGKLTKAEIEAQ